MRENSLAARRRRGRLFLWSALLLCGLWACAPPFRAPLSIRIPPGSPRGDVQTEELSLRVALLSDEDWQLEFFRANLLLAGVLSLHLEMTNRSSRAIELRRARIEVQDEKGVRLAVRTPQQALRQLFQYYKVTTYRIASRQELERRFAEIAFSFTTALAPGETRRGLLFLALPGEGGPREPPARLTVTVTGLRQARAPLSLTVHVSRS